MYTPTLTPLEMADKARRFAEKRWPESGVTIELTPDGRALEVYGRHGCEVVPVLGNPVQTLVLVAHAGDALSSS